MKTYNIVNVIFLNIIMSIVSHGETNRDLDFVFTGSARNEILMHVGELSDEYQKGAFNEQVFNDVSVAIRCVERHAGAQKELGFTEGQCAEYFVALTGNKNVRNIILTAAAIALSESKDLPQNKDPLEGLDPDSDEYKKNRYLIWQRTWGKHFIEAYALVVSPKLSDTKKP